MAEWNQCFYCGQHLRWKERTFDHLVPKSYGGDRFVVACKPCNNLKGESSLDEYREWLGVEKFYGEIQGWECW